MASRSDRPLPSQLDAPNVSASFSSAPVVTVSIMSGSTTATQASADAVWPHASSTTRVTVLRPD